jgi:hypothetical protein
VRYLLPAAAAVLGLALLAGAGPAAGAQAARASASTAGQWDRAESIPGLPALNKGHAAGVGPVSCGAPGNCTAAGSYDSPGYGDPHPFLVTLVRGTWGRVQAVPGLAALNRGSDAGIASLSCRGRGDCTMAGSYTDKARHSQAFVATETGGRWGRALEVPGTAALNQGGGAGASAVSCTAPGDCTVAGSYTDKARHSLPFVVSQVRGRWGQAQSLPGAAALNDGAGTGINQVSCPSAGNCGAGGGYTVGQNISAAFVVSEVHGHWGQAQEVPGLAKLPGEYWAQVYSVSCGSAGSCVAGGLWSTDEGAQYPFLVSETGGRWGTAALVPGMAALGQDRA